MKRVFVVSMSFAGFGGERVAAELAAALCGIAEVTAVQLGDPELPAELAALGCRAVHLGRPGRGPGSAVRLSGALATLLDEARPDAVISMMTFANLVTLLARRRSAHRPPVVVSEHSITSLSMRSEAHRWLMRNACRLLYPSATAVVCVSRASASDLARFLRPARYDGKVILDPCAIEVPGTWGEGGVSDAEADASVRRIACVASLKYAKNHELLLRAVALLEDVALDLVGSGPLRPQLEELAVELGIQPRVVFHGYLADPGRVIRRAHLTVLASRWEGFGLAAVESAVCRVPVVVTPEGALPEVVPRFAPGVVASRSTPRALADAIRQALESPVRDSEWARAAGERHRLLSPQFVAQKYLSLFTDDRQRTGSPRARV